MIKVYDSRSKGSRGDSRHRSVTNLNLNRLQMLMIGCETNINKTIERVLEDTLSRSDIQRCSIVCPVLSSLFLNRCGFFYLCTISVFFSKSFPMTTLCFVERFVVRTSIVHELIIL